LEVGTCTVQLYHRCCTGLQAHIWVVVIQPLLEGVDRWCFYDVLRQGILFNTFCSFLYYLVLITPDKSLACSQVFRE